MRNRDRRTSLKFLGRSPHRRTSLFRCVQVLCRGHRPFSQRLPSTNSGQPPCFQADPIRPCRMMMFHENASQHADIVAQTACADEDDHTDAVCEYRMPATGRMLPPSEWSNQISATFPLLQHAMPDEDCRLGCSN